MDNKDTSLECINIYSQVFIDADELGNAANIFIPLPALEDQSEVEI